MDLFKDLTVQFVLSRIMNIPAARSGAVKNSSHTIFVVDHWNAYLRNYKNLLT